MPREGDIQFFEGQRFIYHEAWDNGNGYVEGPGWYLYPVSQQEIMQGIVDAAFRDDMEVMEGIYYFKEE
jgi:hypothetical protein